MSEHKRRCDVCRQRVTSRIFFRRIDGAWKWLCAACWAERVREEKGAE